MNAFYFSTGDGRNDSGLEIELMLGTGSCSIINYRNFLEMAEFRQHLTVARRKQKTKKHTGDIVPMVALTALSFCCD